MYLEVAHPRRTEDIIMELLRTKNLHASRHILVKRVYRHSMRPDYDVIHDMDHFSSKEPAYNMYSARNHEHANNRKAYGYEASMLIGSMPKPYQFNDNMFQ
jgi:hypothetical protein